MPHESLIFCDDSWVMSPCLIAIGILNVNVPKLEK